MLFYIPPQIWYHILLWVKTGDISKGAGCSINTQFNPWLAFTQGKIFEALESQLQSKYFGGNLHKQQNHRWQSSVSQDINLVTSTTEIRSSKRNHHMLEQSLLPYYTKAGPQTLKHRIRGTCREPNLLPGVDHNTFKALPNQSLLLIWLIYTTMLCKHSFLIHSIYNFVLDAHE